MDRDQGRALYRSGNIRGFAALSRQMRNLPLRMPLVLFIGQAYHDPVNYAVLKGGPWMCGEYGFLAAMFLSIGIHSLPEETETAAKWR